MPDDFGPSGIYTNVPRIDSRGRQQIPMFLRWNPDPLGNEAANLKNLNPDLQRVIARARADNPNLRFVLASGKRSAADQDLAKSWGWSPVGSQDPGGATHMQGNAADLWGLDSAGRVQFQPAQQRAIADAIRAAAKAEGVNLEWGGGFKHPDLPHFELTGGASTAPASTPSIQSAPDNKAIIDTLARNIAQIESGTARDPYSVLGPETGRGQAIGKYQVMPFNIPGWTMAATGKAMTPEEFRASPEAQEAVFRDQAQRQLQLYSPADFASIWFTGKPMALAQGARDINGTTMPSYVTRATAGIPNAGTAVASSQLTPGTAVASNAPAPAPAQPQGPPQTVQEALQRLTAKNEKTGKSALDTLGGIFSPNKDAVAAAARMQPPPMPQAPADIGMASYEPAAQLMAATMQQSAKPLSWSTAPYGSGVAGPQQAPGMTLSSNPYSPYGPFGQIYNG